MSQKRKLRGGGKCYKPARCPHNVYSFVSRHNLKNDRIYVPENMKGLVCVIKNKSVLCEVESECEEHCISESAIINFVFAHHFSICSWGINFYVLFIYCCNGKVNPLQAWTGPEGYRRLRLQYFKTISTWK